MLFRRTLLAGGLVSGAALVLPAGLRAQPAEDGAQKLVVAARRQIGVTLTYDPAYSRLDYPGGDVPRERGVCTDVIVRAYRDGLAIDLQVLVHEDMRKAFSAYPALWGLKRTDRNIDHRRVPNLQTFLKRAGAALPASRDSADYRPGDIVSQMLPGNLPHIGIVADDRSADGARPLLVHNIGAGARLEDVLFAYPLTGHYRYRV
ncbi:DUF1287 domain-containing protein [Shinella sp. HZN7]|jgi:uncharacterized protein YijF (DUF1287 family)|uniref:DUF1287 domain-containing protein n=1 Tax=Shinella sp. (strain HZN7) TaxID=879274 RepID=UPI0007DA643E|nr:DUF1287 domain-containing protein [Shinella sp. HZN7]ANH05989.1 DUF1287 domain-containing protein [Shinella sp. HZN7]